MDQADEGQFCIRIPTQNMGGNAADMRSRLQTWKWRTPSPRYHKEVVFDFSDCQFIEPWALVLFTAYALRIKRETGLSVRAILSPRQPSNVYIGEMGLPHVLQDGTSNPSWDHSFQNTGLHVISSHKDVSRFVESTRRLGTAAAEDTMDALKYSMAEIGRNVVQHSGSSVGGVAMAQYFPDRRAIQISIADCGQGVFASLKATYPEVRNPIESLKLAVLPHVSGAFPSGIYSGSDNAGLGLFFTKEIAWRSGGTFWVVSDNSLLGVRDNDESGQHRIYRSIEPWKGTAVTLDIPERGVIDFAGLLAVCRELAEKARRSSGPAGLDFVDEIPELDGLRTIKVADFAEDVEAAAKVRKDVLLPLLESGELIVLDLSGVRFATQSFVHALLSDAFRIQGSLLRLSFMNCPPSTREAIAMVAAYAASYRQCVN